MKAIGFTGTRHGMSPQQRTELVRLLARELADEPAHDVRFHHGDCVGADAQADMVAFLLGCRPVVHPPIDSEHRAFCKSDRTILCTPYPYLLRNRHIVEETEYLIAAPNDPRREELRSGTWSTIRYARKLGKKVVILGA